MEHGDRHIKSITEAFKGIDRKALADLLHSSKNTIDQVATGHRRVSPRRAMEIEKATSGRVPAAVLRPDIWPEATKRRRAS
jgi:DNA-binding transcriptional regulator YdaS (Cro superfamily)